MFTGKNQTRDHLFKKAMLPRRDRIVRRQSPHSERFHFPWVSASLWSAFSVVGSYILFFSPALMVREVIINGESILPLAEYQEVVDSVMEGSTFNVLSRRNFFFIPTDRIVADVLVRYPQLENVSVQRHFPDRLTLSFTESTALLLWCSGGPCYGVRDGRAIHMSFAEDSRYDSIRLAVVDESALPVTVGGELSVEPYLSTLRGIRENFSKLNIGTMSPVASTPSRYSGEITISVDEEWYLTFSVERPVENSLGTLRAFLTEYMKDHKDRSGLVSIDLRVEGKIFYTEKDGLIAETDPDITGTAPEKKAETKKKKSGQ
ncbi:MAG: hypothetical protein WAT81_05065 [Candidatus Moraniibacteriota bacterium]